MNFFLTESNFGFQISNFTSSTSKNVEATKVEPHSTSLNRYQAELVLRFISITKQFFALKLT